jgi:hypothetical protein
MADGDLRRDDRGERPNVERDEKAHRAFVACYGKHDIESLAWARTDERGVTYEARVVPDGRATMLLLPDDGAFVRTDPSTGSWTFFVCPCGELLESARDETGRDSRPSYPTEIAVMPDEPHGPLVACTTCAGRPTQPYDVSEQRASFF